MKKLKNRRGETLAETLVAMLIATLAMMILAGAIGTASNLVARSRTWMENYAKKNLALERRGADYDFRGKVQFTLLKDPEHPEKGHAELGDLPMFEDGVEVYYYVNNVIGEDFQHPVIAYKEE